MGLHCLFGQPWYNGLGGKPKFFGCKKCKGILGEYIRKGRFFKKNSAFAGSSQIFVCHRIGAVLNILTLHVVENGRKIEIVHNEVY